MIDKVQGEIIVFENGREAFSGATLTGENPADRLPPDAIGKTFEAQVDLKYKVTPAGHFTASGGSDDAYGDVNEVQGENRDIAIDKFWSGGPSEHRDVRPRSPRTEDKHFTYRRIDVGGLTMPQLSRRITDEDETPLYIPPEDEKLATKLSKAPAAPSG
jgi:hypothetical protein